MLLVVACSKGARVATAWIKLKKDYLAEGLADTLDVIPIAAFNGASQRPSELLALRSATTWVYAYRQ